MPTKEKQLLELAEKNGNDADLVLLDLIHEAEEKLDDTTDKAKTNKEKIKELSKDFSTLLAEVADKLKDGAKFKEILKESEVERLVTKVSTRLIDIKKGNDGHTPTTSELKALIDPLIPAIPEVVEGKRGDDGKTPIRGTDYWTEKDRKAIIETVLEKIPEVLTPTGNDLITTINEKNTNKKIKIERIEGLDEALKRKEQGVQSGGVISGRELIKEIDISDQLNGSKKSFDIAVVWNIIMVHGSSFPYALRKTIDWTFTPTNITFTDEIDAATSLASGQTVILMVVVG